MYNTYLLERIGCFQIKDSCKSIDVTKDSKLLLAAATTVGIKIYDTSNGDQKAELKIQGRIVKIKQVELSFSDKYFIVVFEDCQESFMQIFDTKKVLNNGMSKETSVEPIKTIKAPKDHEINCARWGALDKTIYYCTNRGRLIQYDLEEGSVTMARDIHKNEIFKVTITRDFTMLYTCSRDGTCKLLHPQTFDEIRTYQFDFPCRDCSVSPLYESEENQKFHVLMCGGQDAKDVTTTGAQKGGFDIKLYNIIYNEMLANIKGHFGTVHSVAFHPDGLSFASGSEDGYVHFHRMLPEYLTKRFE
jgi:translation initiation factor 3 subunit I